MSAEDIRLLVERCYSQPTGILTPNELDQLNPAVSPAVSSQVTPAPLPGEAIRNLVGRCYSVPVPNQPNPLDQLLPAPAGEEPEPPVVEPPGEIIRTLVGRCYGPPDPPPLTPPPPDIPKLITEIPIPPWVPWIVDITGIPHPPHKITLKPPPPGKMTWVMVADPVKNECEIVAELLDLDLLKELPDYSQDGKGPPGWWEHKETGEKYFCDLSKRIDDPFQPCVKNALECLFRPYFGGMWKPPKTDCDAYWPNGWSGNQEYVCVKNCFPDRIPIYESYDSTGTINVTFDASGQLVATGSGSVEVILKLWWNDRPWTHGTAIDSIDVAGKTFTRVGRSGEQTETITVSSAGTIPVAFTGLHAANSPLLIKDNGTRICMLDGHGNDCNANFTIVSTNASADHAYYETGAKAGYTLTNTEPGFYILRDPIPGKTVPLFRFYSTLKHDTFLTTNPGQPDSPGQGERATMNASGMAGGEQIGHVFPDATAMNSYLAEGEQAEALHRFHSSNPFDHKYKIDGPKYPVKLTGANAYRIPNEVKSDLAVKIDVEKGSSAYDSTIGLYLADETGPKYGRIVCTNAQQGTELFVAYVPSGKLNDYAGGTMGFFLIPNGGNVNSLAVNDIISFEALNTGGNGPGFRGVGVSSAQQNYIFFSDKQWNPQNQKDYTKWQGANTQLWEDLLDGDDDYNDVRLWHQVGWDFDGYMYEGIQCYVYAKAAPEKVMRKIEPRVKCDTRILQASFKDIILRRMDCGTKIPTIVGNDFEWECGKCRDDNTWYYNPATLAWRITKPGGTSSVAASFDASGNLVTSGSGTATVTFSFSWSDNPGTYGTALGTYEITSLGISFTQGNSRSGSSTNQTVTVAAGQTYNCTITDGNAAGFDVTNGNQTLCFKDADGSDCNATLSIVGVEQEDMEIEVTNSVTEKDTWVQVGASNNPANPWTQHMIDHGIYRVVPADTAIDPYLGEWQTHTATFTSTGGNHNLKIETDNYGHVKLTDPSGEVMVDREIDYKDGFGSEVLGLRSLSAGTYTLETRVRNYKLGRYSVELNRYQTIKAQVGGTFRFVSMGGITGGLFGNCIKFTIRVLKNNVELFTKQFEAQYWPRIGADIWDNDITLSAGDKTANPPVEPDTLTFELVSIDTGPVTGDISLELAMYNTENTEFDNVFKLMLGTLSHDGVVAEGMGNPTNNPETAEGGEVEGYAMSFNPTNRQEFEWEPGGIKDDTIPNPPAWQDTNYSFGTRVLGGANIYEATSDIISDGTATVPTHTSGTTDNWKFIRVAPYPSWVEDDVPDPGHYYTYTWANNAPVWMHGSLQDQPEIPGRSRTRNNPLMPHIPGGYTDTGYLFEDDANYFSATILESYNYRNLSGCYNHLLESFLFTRLETLRGDNISDAQREILAESVPTTFARNSRPWYVVGGDNANNKWYVNPACIAWRITQGATEIATSVTNKGDWVKIGEPNNPGNGWTQHMIDYGIYPVKPLDSEIDPYIGEWQTHTTTVTFPSSTTYSIRIESDNWGWLKITDPNSVVIYDAEITYVDGAGGQTIPLTLAAGDYIIETRAKNKNVQGGIYQDTVNAIWNGSQQSPQRDTYFSPLTFVQDYTLDNYHGTGGSNYADACKIRVGITFYPVIFDQTTGSKQVHYWQAMISSLSVVNKGKGYAKGSEFVLTWPPMRERSAEDPSQSPYYPDQEEDFSMPAGKQLAWWENEDLVRRSLKEAFYQESHNKDSVVWYSSTDKAKFRVRFKVTLTSVTDPP